MPPNPRRLARCTACGAAPRRGVASSQPSSAEGEERRAEEVIKRARRSPKLLPEFALRNPERADRRMLAL